MALTMEKLRNSGGQNARVVFLVWPEPGHALPAVSLAKSLVRRGRGVLFLSWDTALPAIRANGLEAVDIFECAGLSEDRERWKAAGGWSERLLDARGDAILGAIRGIDHGLVLLDSLLWRVTLFLTRYSIPCAHLSTSLPDEFDSNVFPWSCTRAPNGSRLAGRVARHLEWERVRLLTWLKYRLNLPIAVDTLDLSDVTKLLKQAEWPTGWCEPRAFHKPALGVPEFVLCPRAFELPEKRPRPYRYYVESGVDLTRHEDTIDFESTLGDPRPLVLAALGSQVNRYEKARELLEIVAAVARNLNEFLFVFAVGDSPVSDIDFPKNVAVHKSVPQLALLKRASAMITHGGLGSAKECITLGVPMCVLPLKWDQPSVGARVEHHGLGMCLRGQQVTVTSVTEAVRRLINNPQFRLRARLMGQEFLKVDQEAPGARLIDALSGRRDAMRMVKEST